jgi:2-phospho-L-lactate transferase/gluconeogenesis factor (CofD/UPF0052 family)
MSEDISEFDNFIRTLDQLCGFARTQYLRDNPIFAEKYERLNIQINEKIPESKEVNECEECHRLMITINNLSNLLHTTQMDAQEMYLDLKTQLDNQFELNKKLIEATKASQELNVKEQDILTKIHEKEEQLKNLEKLNINDIHATKLKIDKEARSPLRNNKKVILCCYSCSNSMDISPRIF